MAKLSFNKLGLTKNEKINVVQFGENNIEVLKYLDIAMKSGLVNAAVRGAIINGVVDEILLDAYLHLFIIENYTNITLTPKQRDNLLETFDIMESNKFFDVVISAMEPGEYEYIFSMAKKLMANVNELNRSIVSIMGNADELMKKLSGQTQ